MKGHANRVELPLQKVVGEVLLAIVNIGELV